MLNFAAADSMLQKNETFSVIFKHCLVGDSPNQNMEASFFGKESPNLDGQEIINFVALCLHRAAN